MPSSVLDLSRWQFAVTAAFHMTFPAITVGLSIFLCINYALYMRTHDPVYLQIYRFWRKIFAVGFALGVVSGIVLTFQFGLNWGVYAHDVGPIIGVIIGMEVATAFFLEAGFIGLGQRPTAVASAAAITLAALGILQLSDSLAAAARDIGRTRAVWGRLARTLSEATGPQAASDSPALEASVSGDPAGSITVAGLSIDRGREVILHDLSFRAAPGQTVLLNGPSGAGKTSVVGVLAGQIPATSGQVRVGGKVVSLPQQPYVFRGTVADNLRLADPAASDDRLREALALVGLDDVLGPAALEQRIGPGGRALSGGQTRRLAIAQALPARPDVLLADEPTEGLDRLAATDLLLELRLSRPRMTVVLALHDQQMGQLRWTPDTVVRLSLARPAPA